MLATLPPARPARPESSDDDLRQRLTAGRYREAFELLVDRFQNKVFRLAISMVRDEMLAQDLAQDVLIKIWKGLPTCHPDTLSSWVYTIARNTCLTELQRRKARRTVSLSEPEVEESLDSFTATQTPDGQAGVAMDVEAMLKLLPEKYRQVLTLYYLEQKSYQQVAALLGIPLGTVKTFLYRAKKELLRLNRRSEHAYS
jgi:RNA polymerase sigma-70 factor (ECF subfamily)